MLQLREGVDSLMRELAGQEAAMWGPLNEGLAALEREIRNADA
jgi:hypothetical protein